MVVRLAQGMGKSLAFSAKKRAQSAVAELCQQARDLGAKKIFLLATHAARKASDGPALVAGLKQSCQLDQAIVLSAEQESRLARLGVKSVFTGNQQGAWVVDIGAGSTEISPLDGLREGIYLPFGALNLQEKFIHHDPPRQSEMTAMRAFIHKHRAGGKLIKGQLLATSGTASCLACLDLGLTLHNPDRINNHVVSKVRLQALLGRLSIMPLPQRAKLPAMAEGRADIIIPGLMVLREIMTVYKRSSVTILDAGILEGGLLAYSNNCKEIFNYESGTTRLDI